MQLNFRGISESYVLNLEGSEALSDVAAAVAEREGSDDVLLYVNGRPLDMEMNLGDLADATVDVTVPLKGGKVSDSRKVLLVTNLTLPVAETVKLCC